MSMFRVNGGLVFSRVNNFVSEELKRLAEAEGVALPVVPQFLSEKALNLVKKNTNISNSRWFLKPERNGLSSATVVRIDSYNAAGTVDSFEESLNKVLEFVSDDGCVANGSFILVGDIQGDVERWTVKNNVISKERVIMSWANGDVFKPYKRVLRW